MAAQQPDSDNLTVSERIQNRFDQLTRAERQLANTILDNYPVSGLGSITALAENSGVSTPTVARMARKLDFGGFPEMQAQLRNELQATISNPIARREVWAENAPDTHILNRFAETVMKNLHQTLKQQSPAEFDAVVDLLCDSDRTIYALGGRITHSQASYFFTYLQMMRGGVTLVEPNSSGWPHYILNMNKGDVLVIFDIRRYERDVQRIAEMAAERGVVLVLFTDQWGSPVAKHAKHRFNARIEVPSAWDSSVVLLFLIEAVIAGVQDKIWDKTSARMEELEELFKKTKLFRKFI